MSRPTGGPAFPNFIEIQGNYRYEEGMSLWDYAFIHAPQLEVSLIADEILHRPVQTARSQSDAYLIARIAWADEFIKQRGG